MRAGKRRRILPLLLFTVVSVALVFFADPRKATQTAIVLNEPAPREPVVEYDEFGIEKSLETSEDRIERNQTFSHILAGFDVPAETIAALVDASKGVFDVRQIRAGASYRVYADESGARFFIYNRDRINFVVFELDGERRVYEWTRQVDTRIRQASGVIEGSLYASLGRAKIDQNLAVRLSEVFAWQIDFFRIQRGDEFSIVYEEQSVDGESIGVGRILAARFMHGGKDFTAFYLTGEESSGYFDAEGNSLRRAFLQAPLDFFRITSHYNPRRLHPVLREVRPHLGTDYAAPHGTPIKAVGDGVVLEAGFSRGNGNYVKIRHNGTYSTGYLHMSRFASGIRRGATVRQGEVIGYVGSTGLATGPHVCYRFWKNGVQVDPRTVEMPKSDPVEERDLDAFEQVVTSLMPRLNGFNPNLATL
jgi:murein DD-endopeptidase MepM/ murein hydrolase activator NlpD